MNELPYPADLLEAEEEEFGICDECGEYTKGLVNNSGEWLCQNCERFK